MLAKYGGFTRRQAAKALGLAGGGGVGRGISKLKDAIAADRKTARLVRDIETELDRATAQT